PAELLSSRAQRGICLFFSCFCVPHPRVWRVGLPICHPESAPKDEDLLFLFHSLSPVSLCAILAPSNPSLRHYSILFWRSACLENSSFSQSYLPRFPRSLLDSNPAF